MASQRLDDQLSFALDEVLAATGVFIDDVIGLQDVPLRLTHAILAQQDSATAETDGLTPPAAT